MWVLENSLEYFKQQNNFRQKIFQTTVGSSIPGMLTQSPH